VRATSTAVLEFAIANDQDDGEYSWTRLGGTVVPGENHCDVAMSDDGILTSLSTFVLPYFLPSPSTDERVATPGHDHVLDSYRVSISPTVSLTPLRRICLSQTRAVPFTSLLPLHSSFLLVSSPSVLILFDVRLGIPLAAHDLTVAPTPPASLPALLSRVSATTSLVSLGPTILAVPHTVPERSLLTYAVSAEARALTSRFLLPDPVKSSDSDRLRGPLRNPLMGDRKAAELDARGRARTEILTALEAGEGDGAATWVDWLARETERTKKYDEAREAERRAWRDEATDAMLELPSATVGTEGGEGEGKKSKRGRNKEKRRQRERFEVGLQQLSWLSSVC
jgi:hypothetical protein